jgi:ABC-type phosphate/phosphonate transport system substrate-binding protein
MSYASLPMYDLPELQAQTDAWWQALARAFRREGVQRVPEQLTRGENPSREWHAPALLFSQCCGYDLTHASAGFLQLIATPVYAVADCTGPDYCSLIIVAADATARQPADLRGYRCAVNSIGSHSGYNALRYLIAPLAQGRTFFSEVTVSGSHAGSLQLIAAGKADCAAIDCVTFALLKRYRPQLSENLRVLAETPQVPGLPYVTSRSRSADEVKRLRGGLQAILNDPALAELRGQLLIAGAIELAADAYQPLLAMEQNAYRAGYPKII